MRLASALAESVAICRLGWPLSVSTLTSFSPRIFLLIAVGHLPEGGLLVGAAGIGSMYANFSQLMLIRSSTFGATPLISQAFGAGNHIRVGVVLMRILAIHACMAVAISLPLTAIARPLLVSVGQPARLASLAQRFLWIRLLGLPAVIVNVDVSTFLNAQQCVRLPMVTNVVGSVIQIALCFTLTRSMGFMGAPLAMTIGELFQATLLVLATPVLLKRHALRTWPIWREAWQALRGWGEIISKGAPAALMVTSEWFGWECSLFIASGLCVQHPFYDGSPAPPPELKPIAKVQCAVVEAIPICTTMLVCQFIIVFGIPLAASNRVGNFLGAGRGEDALFCAKIAWQLTFAAASTLGFTIILNRKSVVALFVSDDEIISTATRLLPVTAVYSMLASLAPGWSSQILFGIGADLRIPALVNFVSFYGIGLPSGSLFAYQAHLAERGLWYGLIFAMMCIIVGQYAYIYFTIDWDQAADQAREKALKEDKTYRIGEGGVCGLKRLERSDEIGLAMADSAKVVSEVSEDRI
ncbi:MAG: hypothetical protein SGPRY_000660 [Prymnesium sp.]